jgi:hypothetical protein
MAHGKREVLEMLAGLAGRRVGPDRLRFVFGGAGGERHTAAGCHTAGWKRG